MNRTMAVIGVGNMAKAILNGMLRSDNGSVSQFVLFDLNETQCESFREQAGFCIASSVAEAVQDADFVLLSVKPQNMSTVLSEIAMVSNHQEKLYISIAAGIASEDISTSLSGARVIRVLPNVPMLIGQGVSLVCQNNAVARDRFEEVCDIFRSTGSILLIDESDMNPMIGVTSSSPAYVFQFIQAILQGAEAQGLAVGEELLSVVCDVVIGSAMLLKESGETPDALIAKVASKGGTTERALAQLCEGRMSQTVQKAMFACTERANELGNAQKQS